MRMLSWFVRRVLPPLLVFVVAAVGVEVALKVGEVESWKVPAPSAVFKAAISEQHARGLLKAAGMTSAAAGLGFALSAVVGSVLAVVLSSSKWIQRAFYPYAVFFQTVPIVAIAPLLVIWLGYGARPVVASAFIVSVFPVIANTLTGILSVDPALRDLFRLYGAGPIAGLCKLKLPSALPHMLTGLRVAAGLAVIGAIVGEFTSSGGVGLGITIMTAMKQWQTDVIFAALILASLLGLAMFGLVNLAGWLLLRNWHASEQGSG